MMGPMNPDWTHLAGAVKAARKSMGLTQIELGERAGVQRSIVQRIERGAGFTRVTSTLRLIEIAVGWKPGSVEEVLAGGDPTGFGVADKASQPETTASLPAASDGLPLRIAEALTKGTTLDTTIVSLGPNADMVVVVKGKPTATPEQLRAELEAWERREGHLERLGLTEGGQLGEDQG